MSKPKWDKVDKKTWARGAYRIERRARDQFVALGPPGEGDDEKTPGDLGCWGKLALAKAACDEHEAGLGEGAEATAMVWTRDDETQAWTASGPNDQTYVLEQDDKRWYITIDGEELCGPEGLESRELAEALCQGHRDTELKWREAEPGSLWVATSAILSPSEDYCVTRGSGLELQPNWQAQHLDDAIGDPGITLYEAQQVCQEHHRELVGQPDGERDVKPEKPGQLPAPQRADWVIPMPLSEAEMVAAFEAGRKLRRRKRSLQREVAASHERHKKLAKRNQELIDKLEEEIEELDERMPEKPVDCFRAYVRDGEEIWVTYYTGTGTDAEQLHEHKLTQFEQRQLFGEGDPPADKPPSKGDQLLDELDAAIKRAFVEKTPGAITAAGDAIDAAAAHLQGEQLKELRARHALVAATSVFSDETDPLPPDLDLSDRRQWTKMGAAYVTSGEPHYRIEKAGNKLRHGVFVDASGKERCLPGYHTTLKQAIEQAAADNVKRLRWQGDPEATTQLDTRNRYQLQLMEQGDDGDDLWRAEAVGMLGQQNEELTTRYVPLPAAQAVCQHHADAGRAGQ
jgi:hypothetical protein